MYSKTLALAKAEFEKIDAIEKMARQKELMGLGEGATLSPTAKTFITNVTYLDVEKQKLVSNATIGITGNTITSITEIFSHPKPMLPSLTAVENFYLPDLQMLISIFFKVAEYIQGRRDLIPEIHAV